jgi:dynactin complex subunit
MVDGLGVGKLRFCGQKSIGNQAVGVHCGVEFAKPVGNTNGVVDGVESFTCKPNHGVLIPIAKVKRLTPTERDIGKLVTVKGYDCLAVLQFYGAHKEKGHLRCGIELEEAVGNNDGTVNGHEYFSCEKGFGVLCAVKKVTVYHDELTAPKLRGGGEASA